jgi:3-oxoacyl-[acyl-carrier-protein] synthase I
MKSVYLAGRGLACSLGLDLAQAIHSLRHTPPEPVHYTLPGAIAGSYPYYELPFHAANWDERARQLILRVVAEAGAARSRLGVLFIASSSLDIGAAEQGAAHMDFGIFADKIAGWLEWLGPVYVVSTACTSSLNALLAAHALLQQGEAEEAMVLGIELDGRLTLGGFAALQLLSPTGSKPFGAKRDGLVLGEAVAALRLSTRETGQWQMSGGSNVVDGSQPTSASVSAVEAMCSRALAQSGLDAGEIDLVKVQAAGSPGNDAAEAEGLNNVFSPLPALVSLKAAMGHTMGASGAAEVALLTACLEQGAWPVYPDDIDTTLQVNLPARMPGNVRRVLAAILGFGGSHAAVVLERAQ